VSRSIPKQCLRRSADEILQPRVCRHGTSRITTKPSFFSVARFRVKKKVKAHDLERTVSGLSERVDELEQEATDLRRENGWLKEIIVLKSGAARGGDFLAGPSQPSSSRDTQGDEEESEEGGSVDDDK
jgi:hypothetical protein